MTAMYEMFEHTADLGLRVRAASLDALLADAAQALFAAILEGPPSVKAVERIEVRLAAEEPAYLLFDWLNELLYHFETKRLVFGRFEVQTSGEGFAGSAWGEPLDPARHALAHEVKAITYHGLRVEQADGGWLAEVIVDI